MSTPIETDVVIVDNQGKLFSAGSCHHGNLYAIRVLSADPACN